jgi:Sec-independent protein translocase protein TatA
MNKTTAAAAVVAVVVAVAARAVKAIQTTIRTIRTIRTTTTTQRRRRRRRRKRAMKREEAASTKSFVYTAHKNNPSVKRQSRDSNPKKEASFCAPMSALAV